MSRALPLSPPAPSPVARPFKAALDAGLTALHLLVPVLAGVGMAAAFAAGRSASLQGAGLAALIGGMAFAYLHDRIAPDRKARECGGNPIREARLSQLGAFPHAAAVLAAGIALAGVACDLTRLLPLMVALAVVALAYPLLAVVPFGKTLAVAGSWTLAITLLPTDNAGLVTWTAGDWISSASILLLVCSGAVLCDLKDVAADRRIGIWNLGGTAGTRAACAAAATCAGLGGALIACGAPWALGLPAVGLLYLSRRPDLVEREVTGPLAVDGCLATAGLAVLLSEMLSGAG